MTTIDETDDKPLQIAENSVIDAHYWGTTSVVDHLNAMKFFTVPALEMCSPDWMAMAKGSTELALEAAQSLVRNLTEAVEDLEAAAVYAKRYES